MHCVSCRISSRTDEHEAREASRTFTFSLCAVCAPLRARLASRRCRAEDSSASASREACCTRKVSTYTEAFTGEGLHLHTHVLRFVGVHNLAWVDP